FLLQKYLRNRKDRPAALIFAGDPQNFLPQYRAPIHDQSRLYADDYRMGVGAYLWARFHKRVSYALSGGEPRPERGAENEALLWRAFSHRYLQLFSMRELAAQYTGAERVFLLREALPNVSHLYRYRDAIEHHTL